MPDISQTNHAAAEAIANRQRANDAAVTPEERTQAAAAFGISDAAFRSIYRGSKPEAGMNFKHMLPEQRQAILHGAASGMFFRPENSFSGYVAAQKTAQDADPDETLSRGEVKRLLRYAQGSPVQYVQQQDGRIQFMVGQGKDDVYRSDALRVSPRALAYLSRALGEPAMEAAPAEQISAISTVVQPVPASAAVPNMTTAAVDMTSLLQQLSTDLGEVAGKKNDPKASLFEQFLSERTGAANAQRDPGTLNGQEATALLNALHGAQFDAKGRAALVALSQALASAEVTESSQTAGGSAPRAQASGNTIQSQRG